MSWADSSLKDEIIPEINFDCKEGKPVQLIRLEGKRFELTEEAEKFLSELSGYIGICAIGGKLRTGKSFLLNKLIGLDRKEGFAVSDSVNACTKGLWIWSQPIYNEKNHLNIVFMDTEGLDSIDRDPEIDAKLFALTVLFSSYFIYNTVGSIDQMSINGLALVGQLIRTVVVNEGEDALNEYILASYAPKMLWVLRDFMLQMKDVRGKIISSRMYLETALTSMAVSETSQGRNLDQEHRLRSCIVNFFRHRDCLTLVRPVINEDEVQLLPSLPNERLRPEFLNGLNLVKNKIWQNCSPKMINGSALTPALMILLIKQFTNAFNAKKIPCINSAWKTLLVAETEKAEREALELHRKMSDVPIESVEELQKLFLQARDAAFTLAQRVYYVEDRMPEVYEKMIGRLTARINSQEIAFLDNLKQRLTAESQRNITQLYSNFIKNNEMNQLESKDVGELLMKEVYQPLFAQCKEDSSQAIAFATTQFSPTLLGIVTSSLERERAARLYQSAKNEEAEKAILNAQGETLIQKEAQMQELEDQIEKIDEKLAELQNQKKLENKEFFSKKEEIDTRIMQVKEQINALGNILSENRLNIEKQEKKKKKFCG